MTTRLNRHEFGGRCSSYPRERDDCPWRTKTIVYEDTIDPDEPDLIRYATCWPIGHDPVCSHCDVVLKRVLDPPDAPQALPHEPAPDRPLEAKLDAIQETPAE